MSPGWEDLARKNAARGKFVEKRQNWHDYLNGGDEDADSEDLDVEGEEAPSEAAPDGTAAEAGTVPESNESSPRAAVHAPTAGPGTSREQSSERE